MSPVLLACGIGLAGAAGALLRYWLQRALRDRLRALLTVNVAGSLLAGLVAGLSARGTASTTWTLSADAALILIVGLAGALTTFSTWAVFEMSAAVSNYRRVCRVAAMVLGTILAALLGLGLAAGIHGLFE